MLESMVRQDRPTRAEASDVANAILDGTDAVMLSEETAAGRHPVETVQMMARIAQAVEAGAQPGSEIRHPARPSFAHAIAAATRVLAAELPVELVVALTTTGHTARLLSQMRPRVPILAYTEDERVARLLSLYWGVRPMVTRFQPNTEAMIRFLDRDLVRRRIARPGSAVVIVGSVPIIARGRTNFIQLHEVGRAGTAR